MNERHVLCAIGVQSGFMYVGREVFDEIVASARPSNCNPIHDRAGERLISLRGVIDSRRVTLFNSHSIREYRAIRAQGPSVARNRTTKSIRARNNEINYHIRYVFNFN